MYEAGRPVLGAQATSRTQSLWPSSVSSIAHSFVSSLREPGGADGGGGGGSGRRRAQRGEKVEVMRDENRGGGGMRSVRTRTTLEPAPQSWGRRPPRSVRKRLATSDERRRLARGRGGGDEPPTPNLDFGIASAGDDPPLAIGLLADDLARLAGGDGPGERAGQGGRRPRDGGRAHRVGRCDKGVGRAVV